MKVGFGIAYDSNLLDASDAELRAFEEDDPQALFVVDRMEDACWQGVLEADWELGRLLGARSKLRASYERTQFLYNPIKSADLYALGLRVRLSSEMRMNFEASFRPQVYGRHRVDKDAGPGEPQFRAEVHRRWDAGVELTHSLGERWEVLTELRGSLKDYNRPFNERDRRRVSIIAGVGGYACRKLELHLAGGFRRTLSRNEPDLGKDLSCREWIVDPRIRVEGLAAFTDVEISLETRWRAYTSSNLADWNHVGRNDRIGGFCIDLTRALSTSLAWTVSYDHRWRTARLDSGLSIDYDEEGSSSESVYRTALVYQWES